jgi:predicted membrane metal-binding protein
LFIAAVLAFLSGIFIEATYPLPFGPLTAVLLLLLVFLLVGTTRLRLPYITLPLMLVAFLVAGMVRLAPIVAGSRESTIPEGMNLYQGTVIECSAQTKVIRLTAPDSVMGIKAVFRDSGSLTLDDRVRLFGQIIELSPTFKNPSLTSWKWLKRLEGINYQFKGSLISTIPGTSYVEVARHWLKEKTERSGVREAPVIMALTIGDRTGIDDSITQLFLRTGTSHILAISGFQTALVSGVLFFLFQWLFRRSRPLRLSGRAADMRLCSHFLSLPSLCSSQAPAPRS